MTNAEFVAKWKHLLEDCHPSYSSDARNLFWCASYDVKAECIPELVEDFLNIPGIEEGDGMAYRRALKISLGEEV